MLKSVIPRVTARISTRALSSTAAVASDAVQVHRDSAHNNASVSAHPRRVLIPAESSPRPSPASASSSTLLRIALTSTPLQIPFALNATNQKFAEEIISRYPPQYKKAAIIPILEIAQKQNKGWISISAMNHVAKLLEIPPMRAYEVASFYTMFNREPVGEHFVQICTTTPCMLGGCGSDSIVKTITSHLGVGLGQTTPDNKFTIIEVECLGACSNAPMVQINDKFYEDLTPETTIHVLDELAAGKQPKTGPQNGRSSCESLGPPTALFEEPPTPAQFCVPEWR